MTPGAPLPRPPFDVDAIRARLSRSCRRTVHGKPLVYLDNAATTQKPQAVIDALVDTTPTTTPTCTAAVGVIGRRTCREISRGLGVELRLERRAQ